MTLAKARPSYTLIEQLNILTAEGTPYHRRQKVLHRI